MAVVGFEITRREVYADGQEFGEAGVYERIDGVVEYAVDPLHERNLAIADLELALRAADGLVHFFGDASLLMPRDAERGSRRLFMELPNRGRRLVPRSIHRATNPNEHGGVPAGDGLLFNKGFIVGTIGWQWDVFRGEGVLGVDAPNAEGVSGPTMIRFQTNATRTTKVLTDRAHRPLPASDFAQPHAQLIVRDWEVGPGTTIPRDQWQFAREEDGRVIPDLDTVYYAPGFEAGKIYEVIYTTDCAPVGGVGLLAVRDFTSFLRYDKTANNPCAGRIEWAYGFGISQTGRILRRFVCLGMNLDESNRQVFDGLNPHVAGARQGDYNCRFGQPGNAVQATPNFGSYFPYTDEPMPHPMTGRVDGLLNRQREIGGVPKIFWTNTSAEYWRGDGYLLHIDPDGKRDLEPSPETRIYSFAGTQHSAGTLPMSNVDPNNDAMGRYPFNVVDQTPLMRAAIVNLDRWVSEGIEPPASYHPRISDGTAVTYQQAIDTFPEMAGFERPSVDQFRVMPRVDLGPEADKGIHQIPAKLGKPFRALVWNLDADGNETAPVRLPDLAVPVGTHTGWNPRHPDGGAPGHLMPMRGFTNFMPETADDRERTGDGRLSIDERYADKDDYLAKVRVVVEELVAGRHVLEEDIESVVNDAAARYDAARQR